MESKFSLKSITAGLDARPTRYISEQMQWITQQGQNGFYERNPVIYTHETESIINGLSSLGEKFGQHNIVLCDLGSGVNAKAINALRTVHECYPHARICYIPNDVSHAINHWREFLESEDAQLSQAVEHIEPMVMDMFQCLTQLEKKLYSLGYDNEEWDLLFTCMGANTCFLVPQYVHKLALTIDQIAQRKEGKREHVYSHISPGIPQVRYGTRNPQCLYIVNNNIEPWGIPNICETAHLHVESTEKADRVCALLLTFIPKKHARESIDKFSGTITSIQDYYAPIFIGFNDLSGASIDPSAFEFVRSVVENVDLVDGLTMTGLCVQAKAKRDVLFDCKSLNRKFTLREGEMIRLSEGPIKSHFFPREYFEQYLCGQLNNMTLHITSSDDDERFLSSIYISRS